MTGGMCWEAMGNIGACPGRPVIVVLNDNGRSYGPTVGSLGGHLGMLRLAAASVRPIRPAGGNLFKALGFRYIGPGDGPPAAALERALPPPARLGPPRRVHPLTPTGTGA